MNIRVQTHVSMAPDDVGDLPDNKERKLKGLYPILYRKCAFYQIETDKRTFLSEQEMEQDIYNLIKNIFFYGNNFEEDSYEIKRINAFSKFYQKNDILKIIHKAISKNIMILIEAMLNCNNSFQLADFGNQLYEKTFTIALYMKNISSINEISSIMYDNIHQLINNTQKEKVAMIFINDFLMIDINFIDVLKYIYDLMMKIRISNFFIMKKIIQKLKNRYKEIIEDVSDFSLKEFIMVLIENKVLIMKYAKNLFGECDIYLLSKSLNKHMIGPMIRKIRKELHEILINHNFDLLGLCYKASKEIDFVDQFRCDLLQYLKEISSKMIENDLKLFSIFNLKLTDFNHILPQKLMELINSTIRETINTNPELISSLLAEKIHYEFIRDPKADANPWFLLFKILKMKDIFEECHTFFLLKRMINQGGEILQADLDLIQLINNNCGENYTQRFNALVHDANFTKKSFQNFKNEFDISPQFKTVLISQDVILRGLQRDILRKKYDDFVPEFASLASRQYLGFLKEKFPQRKFKWNMNMTEVELVEKNSNFKIVSNALYASVILSFNNKISLSIYDLIKSTKFGRKEVENIISKLKSKTVGILVVDKKSHHKWKKSKFLVNELMKNGYIEIPSIYPLGSVSKNDKCSYFQENHVDCFIMKLLKDKRKIRKTELINLIKNDIQNSVNEEFIEKRIEILNAKYLLQINESNEVTYLE